MSKDSVVFAVDTIFSKYDADFNECLDADELFSIVKDAQGLLGINTPIREDEISEFIKRKAKEGKEKGLTRSDLEEIFWEIKQKA